MGPLFFFAIFALFGLYFAMDRFACLSSAVTERSDSSRPIRQQPNSLRVQQPTTSAVPFPSIVFTIYPLSPNLSYQFTIYPLSPHLSYQFTIYPLSPPFPINSLFIHYPPIYHINSCAFGNSTLRGIFIRWLSMAASFLSAFWLFIFHHPSLIRLCHFAHLPSSQPHWQCPNNGTYFDATPCDPNATFSCPALYKCRMAVESDGEDNKIEEMKAGKRVRWICCESGGMGIREWLLESGLAPSVFPKVPNATLRRVFLRDEQSGKVIAVDGNGADISVLNFDNSESANYSRLEGIEFDTEVPRNGGFLHIVVAINQLTSPSALQLYFDYSSFGIAQIDLGAQNDRFPRGYAQSIGSGFVSASLAYRSQNVLTVFHTDVPIANLSEDIDRSMAVSDGKLQRTMFGSNGGNSMAKLFAGTPIAGFIYTITTRASIFPLTYDQQWKNLEKDGSQMTTLLAQTAPPVRSPTAISAKDRQNDQLGYNAGGINPVTMRSEFPTTASANNRSALRTVNSIMILFFIAGGLHFQIMRNYV